MNRWLLFALLALCVCGRPTFPHRRHDFRHEVKPKDGDPEPEPDYLGWASAAELPCSYIVEGTEVYTETSVNPDQRDNTYTSTCTFSTAFDSADVVVHKSLCDDGWATFYLVRGDLTNDDHETPFVSFNDDIDTEDPEIFESSIDEDEAPFRVADPRGAYTYDFPYLAIRTEEVEGETITWYTIAKGDENNYMELGLDKDGLLRYDHSKWDEESGSGEDSFTYTYKFDKDVTPDSFKVDAIPGLKNEDVLEPLQRVVCKSVQIPEVDCAVKFSFAMSGMGGISGEAYAMPSGFLNFPPIIRAASPAVSLTIRPDLYTMGVDEDGDYIETLPTAYTHPTESGTMVCEGSDELFDTLTGICNDHFYFYPFVRRYFEFEGEPQSDTCQEGACKKYCRGDGTFCLTLLDAEPHYAVKYTVRYNEPTPGPKREVSEEVFQYGVPTPFEEEDTSKFVVDATTYPGCAETAPGVYEEPQFFAMCSKEPSSSSSSSETTGDNSSDKSGDNSGGAGGNSEPENKEESVEASSQVTVHVAVVVAALAVALLSIF